MRRLETRIKFSMWSHFTSYFTRHYETRYPCLISERQNPLSLRLFSASPISDSSKRKWTKKPFSLLRSGLLPASRRNLATS
jgi:hypothetical protein